MNLFINPGEHRPWGALPITPPPVGPAAAAWVNTHHIRTIHVQEDVLVAKAYGKTVT